MTTHMLLSFLVMLCSYCPKSHLLITLFEVVHFVQTLMYYGGLRVHSLRGGLIGELDGDMTR